jgi:hypothetical protein
VTAADPVDAARARLREVARGDGATGAHARWGTLLDAAREGWRAGRGGRRFRLRRVLVALLDLLAGQRDGSSGAS